MFAQLSQVSRKNMYKQQLNQVNLSYSYNFIKPSINKTKNKKSKDLTTTKGTGLK